MARSVALDRAVREHDDRGENRLYRGAVRNRRVRDLGDSLGESFRRLLAEVNNQEVNFSVMGLGRRTVRDRMSDRGAEEATESSAFEEP